MSIVKSKWCLWLVYTFCKVQNMALGLKRRNNVGEGGFRLPEGKERKILTFSIILFFLIPSVTKLFIAPEILTLDKTKQLYIWELR